MKLKSIHFAAIAAFTFASAANAATVIYFDDFNDSQNINKSGPYTQSLAGSAPTTRIGAHGGSASATWSSNVETSGWGQRDLGDSNVATPTSSNYLSFTPEAGWIYTLEADITVNVNVGDDWFAIGFVQSPSNWVVSGAFTVADYNAGTEQGIVRWNGTNLNQTRHVTYTLDTTAPGWTNTQNIGYVGWFTSNPGGVNLNGANQVSIDNFSLTAIPEPSAALLGGLGLLALLRRRR
jgi:hypothetical protein